jgi:hypothetical protein
MALLSPQQISVTGLQATYSAVNSTDTVNPDDDLILHVKTAGTSTTVTLTDSSKTQAGSSASNPTISVTTPTDRFIFLPAALGLNTGVITVSYSATTSVTAALLKM